MKSVPVVVQTQGREETKKLNVWIDLLYISFQY